jgi:hypothetical protein
MGALRIFALLVAGLIFCSTADTTTALAQETAKASRAAKKNPLDSEKQETVPSVCTFCSCYWCEECCERKQSRKKLRKKKQTPQSSSPRPKKQ